MGTIETFARACIDNGCSEGIVEHCDEMIKLKIIGGLSSFRDHWYVLVEPTALPCGMWMMCADCQHEPSHACRARA